MSNKIIETDLSSFYPSTQQWEDVDYSPKEVTCHICTKETAVKQGCIIVRSPIEEQLWPGLEKRHSVNFLLDCRTEHTRLHT